MGFKREAPTLVLTFEGELSGLEVETATLSRRQYERIAQLHQTIGNNDRPSSDEAWAAWGELCEAFADVLLKWNLEDMAGNPRPCDADELDRQGIEFTMALIVGWLKSVETYSASLIDKAQSGDLGDYGDFDESMLPSTPIQP